MSDSKRQNPGGLWVYSPRQQWCKTINKQRVYLLKVADDPDGSKSYELFVLRKHEIETGSPILEADAGAVTVADCADAWLQHIQGLVDRGERSKRTFEEYYATASIVVEQLGKNRIASTLKPSDFAALRRVFEKRKNAKGKLTHYGPVVLRKMIVQTKTLFRFAFDEGLLDKEVEFGRQSFAPPEAKVLRKARFDKGLRSFSAQEVRSILEACNATQRAMVLLGVNAALGNSDVADLETRHLNMRPGWLVYPRGKTGIEREIPLWPETTEALKNAMQQRPPSAEGYVFTSKNGKDYRDPHRTGWRITGEFRQVLKRAGLADGRGFYGLRRTCQTIAETCGDIVAVKAIMGHSDSETDMSARYSDGRLSEERRQRAVDTVRAWLFPAEEKPKRTKRKPKGE